MQLLSHTYKHAYTAIAYMYSHTLHMLAWLYIHVLHTRVGYFHLLITYTRSPKLHQEKVRLQFIDGSLKDQRLLPTVSGGYH